MSTWLYTVVRRLGVQEAGAMATDKECLACKSRLLRLAERATSFPYSWNPNGWICSRCNACYIDVP